MEIVTNHGMPVRWSTAHYRFSRAPCTATLYRRPSLARSFTSPRLSSSRPDLSRVLSPELPSPSSLHALSLSLYLPPAPSRSLLPARAVRASRSSSSSGVLRPNGDRGAIVSSLSLARHPPPGASFLYRRCCPPLSTPNVSPPHVLSHPPRLSRSTSRRYSSSPFHSIYPLPLSRATIPQRPLSSVPLTQRRTARLNSYSLAVRVTFEAREQIRRREERKRKEMLAATRKRGKRRNGEG